MKFCMAALKYSGGYWYVSSVGKYQLVFVGCKKRNTSSSIGKCADCYGEFNIFS